MNIKVKEKQLKRVCDLSKIKNRTDDGRKYFIIKRKPISSSTYEGLIEKLYDHFFGDNAATLETYFETWMEWREKETSLSKKTLKKNRFMWNSLLKDQDITLIHLKDLTAKDLIVYFRNRAKGRQMTRKRFNDIKSIMNGILYLAVENDIIERNCLRDINYKQFTYKSENASITPYTEEERLQIINHLGDDFYSLAIKLDFYLILRIGELKGLRWDDVSDFHHVQKRNGRHRASKAPGPHQSHHDPPLSPEHYFPGRNSIKNEGYPGLIALKKTKNAHANKRKHQIHKAKTPETLILSGF